MYQKELILVSYMFSDCSSLIDIKPLEKWNLDKNNFESMFKKY